MNRIRKTTMPRYVSTLYRMMILAPMVIGIQQNSLLTRPMMTPQPRLQRVLSARQPKKLTFWTTGLDR